MTNNVITFGTEAYAVVSSTSHGYAYLVRLCDHAVTHLSVCGEDDVAVAAMYTIYQQNPDQFEDICARQEYYPAPAWRMN